MRRRDFLIGAGAFAAGAGLEHLQNKKNEKLIEQKFQTKSVEETIELIVKYTKLTAPMFKERLQQMKVGTFIVVQFQNQPKNVRINRVAENHFEVTIKKHFGEPASESPPDGQAPPLQRPGPIKPKNVSRA